ncbi:MAG: hypothetical protein GY898_11215 [Proteobacteria bacterium]|nr:hypothetical protein [Pseudomonadota bacterium]
MATKIPIGTSAYFTDFDGGQGGGASNYFTYAADLDTNFLLQRTTINQMIDEISAVSGPNATIAVDTVRWDDDQNPIDPAEPMYGVLGPASYEVSVVTGTLTIRKGQVLINLEKQTLISDITGITSSGGAGTRYVALDYNGQPFIETLPNQRAVDLATVTWDGAQFTAGTVVHLVAVLIDGDSWAECQDRAVTPNTPTFAAHTFRRVAARIRALELFLAGQDEGDEGEPIDGPMVFLPGTVGAPSLVFGDGGATIDSATGWYRPGANRWGYSGSGVLKFDIQTNGIVFSLLGTLGAPAIRTTGAGFYWPVTNEIGCAVLGDLVWRAKNDTSKPQFLVGDDGDVTDPGLAWSDEENTGFYRPAAAQLALALGGVQKVLWDTNGIKLPDGAEATPAVSFLGDTNSGMYRKGADDLGISTAGNEAVEITDLGQVNFPLQGAALGSRSVPQTGIVTATPTLISFDTEDLDRTGWITVPSTTFTCPTGFGGIYLLSAYVEWNETGAGSNTGDRRTSILRNSSEVVALREDSAKFGSTKQPVTTAIIIADGDTVELEVYHDSGSNRAVDVARMGMVRIN